MLPNTLHALVLISCAYWLFTLVLIYRFFRSRPAHAEGFTPPVSILKPARGVDHQAYENFVSFCQQDYPRFELLFGVADARDPVIPVVERVQREFPRLSIRLVVAPAFGANRKASLLHHLSELASYEVLAVSDSDVRVTPDYLRRVVAPLSDERVGLVTCLYRGEEALTLTARLEALYMGATFTPLALMARQYLRMRLALGATMVLRKSGLRRIGGFAALADCLADDYQLGRRIANLGEVVHLSHYVVACVLGATTFREQWDREVRWARNNRVSRPREFPLLPLTFATPLAVIAVLASGLSSYAWWALALALAVRYLVGWVTTGFTGDRVARRWLFLLPLRDLLTALVWCAGLIGRGVVWRGEEYRLESDGRLVALSEQPREVVERKHIHPR